MKGGIKRSRTEPRELGDTGVSTQWNIGLGIRIHSLSDWSTSYLGRLVPCS